MPIAGVEQKIQTAGDVGAGKDALATTVSARKLVDILRALPDAIERFVKSAKSPKFPVLPVIGAALKAFLGRY